MKASFCPDGNYVDSKCPGDETIKCCLSAPFLEDKCKEKGGECMDQCACQGETLLGDCPNQPRSIRCCVDGPEDLGDHI